MVIKTSWLNSLIAMRSSKIKMCCLLQEVHRACYVKFSGATVVLLPPLVYHFTIFSEILSDIVWMFEMSFWLIWSICSLIYSIQHNVSSCARCRSARTNCRHTADFLQLHLHINWRYWSCSNLLHGLPATWFPMMFTLTLVFFIPQQIIMPCINVCTELPAENRFRLDWK